MRCLGITKDLRRCRNDAARAFCRAHRLQPVTGVVVVVGFVGFLAGLYQDLLKPLLFQEVPSFEGFVGVVEGEPYSGWKFNAFVAQHEGEEVYIAIRLDASQVEGLHESEEEETYSFLVIEGIEAPFYYYSYELVEIPYYMSDMEFAQPDVLRGRFKIEEVQGFEYGRIGVVMRYVEPD